MVYQLNGVQTVTIRQHEIEVSVAGNVDELIDSYLQAQQQGLVAPERSPFGAVLWPSGRAFINYFDKKIQMGIESVPKCVVELGSGVGLVSSYFAAIGSEQVLATDYESGLVVYINENSKSVCRALSTEERAQNVTFMHLDWSAPAPEILKGNVLFLVATDVLYEEIHIECLPRIARELLHPKGVFYLADPERYRYAAALQNLKREFAHIEITTIDISNLDNDVKLGTVSTGKSLTKVQVLKCTK